MADIEFAVGEFGDSYDITIYDEENSGSVADLDNFDTFTMTIKTSDLATQILQVTLSKPGGTTGVVRWAMTSGQTSSVTAGTYIAQIDMVDTSVTNRKKTRYMSCEITEKLA